MPYSARTIGNDPKVAVSTASGPRSWSCTHVPKAPSKIRTRSRRAARKSDIGDRLPERLPRLACQFHERFVARRSARATPVLAGSSTPRPEAATVVGDHEVDGAV